MEALDYYQEKNVFWVPKESTALPNGSVLWSTQPPNEIKLRSISWRIDNALDAIESANIELNGILNRVSQYQLDNDKFIGLINSFSDTSFIQTEFNGRKLSMHSKDILGHVYDPAMGSGGFFVSSEKFIEEHAKEKHYNPADTEKDIAKHDFALTPGRYVGGAEQEADSEPFAEKMARLTGQLKTQFAESARLENEIKKNLLSLGYEI